MIVEIISGLGQLAFEAYDKYIEPSHNLDESVEEEIQERIAVARISVSLWSHCSLIDNEMSKEEDELTDLLIGSLFEDDSLFPAGFPDRDIISEELLRTFNNPFSMKTIINFAKENDELATNLYHQACMIIASDHSIKEEEKEFLEDLAVELEISRMDRRKIEKAYLSAVPN